VTTENGPQGAAGSGYFENENRRYFEGENRSISQTKNRGISQTKVWTIRTRTSGHFEDEGQETSGP